jgi:hypothetical protein
LARLPDSTVLGGLPGLDSGRPIARYDDTAIARGGIAAAEALSSGGQALGRGLSNFGTASVQAQLQQDENEATRARAEALAAKVDLDSEFSKDAKYQDMAGRYEQRLKEVTEKASGLISRPEARERFLLGFTPTVRQGVASITSRARKLEGDTNVGYVLEKNNALLTSAVEADDDIRAGNALTSANYGIDYLVQKGWKTPAEGVAMKKQLVLDYAHAVSYKKMNADPKWLEDRLQNPQGTPLEFLPIQERYRLLDHATRAIDTRSRAAQVEEDRQRKAEGEERLKEVYSLASRGELRPAQVEAARPFISPTEYNNLLKLFKPDGAENDPEAMADLVTRIDTEAPADFQKAAAGYLRQGKLKTETFLSLAEKNRTASKDDQPASPYRSGREMVKVTLDPGQLLSGAAAAVARNSQAQALSEFDNWSTANPRADRATAMSQAQDIIKRYQVVPYDQMKMATGVSRYFGSKSRNEVTITDVDAAETKLWQDIQSGRLSREQQEFEIRLLENWRGILTREQAAPKEPERGRTRR